MMRALPLAIVIGGCRDGERMLAVTYRKHGIRLTHVWFVDDEDVVSDDYRKDVGGDLIFLHGTRANPAEGLLYTTQHTLIKDLRPSEDELFAALGKHLRQYIRRSVKDEGIRVEIWDSKELQENASCIECSAELFERMFHDKGMSQSFNMALANKYITENALTIGMAYDCDTPLGFSAVIHDSLSSRLWTSAFDFRNPNHDGQVLSRAHQRLDWEIILWHKRHGMVSFDFGGVNSFDEPDGIAQFKMRFESKGKVTYNNYLIPRTLLGKAALQWFIKGRKN